MEPNRGYPVSRVACTSAGAELARLGCGTGVLTGLIADHRSPAAVFGIDSQRAQVEHAKRQGFGRRVTLRVANAEALPFSDRTFDVVVSALALNFIADRSKAMSEMRRVARPRGTVAVFVWDFEGERSPSWPLRLTIRSMGVGTRDPRDPCIEHQRCHGRLRTGRS